MVACPLGDSARWQFYLINDGEAPLNSAVLSRVSYEWGNQGHSEEVAARVDNLACGAHAFLWTDDSSGGELRMELPVRVRAGGREVTLVFFFPMLYKKKDLPLVAELGRPGWREVAEG